MGGDLRIPEQSRPPPSLHLIVQCMAQHYHHHCHHGHCWAISIKLLRKREDNNQHCDETCYRLIFVMHHYCIDQRHQLHCWLLAKATVAIIVVTPLGDDCNFVVQMNS
jgi:hypothetical protein